ncbi:MAG TPA: SIS domain-containing protein [Dinghuibacter sp.]|jgi:D-sedoheptulose 7-phosphate isomerase|uniref:D-sedoheptulose-7-phosphate isomerase n=1 Tax=Dinghuibacter sp. TaxID=2024697 RepID=UPI002C565767|nr:SIS domain-containing protein [Dinghuibacter sp.]HTJ10961.1 SIS domain-containing protein [Dinghuibacter sp.]
MNNLDKIHQKHGLEPVAFSRGYVNYLIELLQQLDHEKIAECIRHLEEARHSHGTIFVIGNGGSASTASHVGNDFGLAVLKKSKKDADRSYRALALTDNVSVLSAIGNDKAFEHMFVDQLRVHFRPGDKLIVISASGNSPNLVVASEWFKQQGGTVIGWLGFDGGKLKDIVDVPIVVRSPKGEYAPVEDIHLVINHIIVTWMQYNITNEA